MLSQWQDFILLWLGYILLCIYVYTVYIHKHTVSSLSILLRDTSVFVVFFNIFAIINNTAVDNGVHIPFLISVFNFGGGKYTEVELLDHMAVLFLIFGGISIRFLRYFKFLIINLLLNYLKFVFLMQMQGCLRYEKINKGKRNVRKPIMWILLIFIQICDRQHESVHKH